jgi:hypothetical protein
MGKPLMIKSGALSLAIEVLPRMVIRVAPAGPADEPDTFTPATLPASDAATLVSRVFVKSPPSTLVTE